MFISGNTSFMVLEPNIVLFYKYDLITIFIDTKVQRYRYITPKSNLDIYRTVCRYLSTKNARYLGRSEKDLRK